MPCSLRVLLVDDQPSDLILLGDLLSDASVAVEVTTALSGEAALAHLDSAAALPHVILLDWHLGGMSGLDVLRAVKTSAQWRGIGVVIRSGSADPGDRCAAIQAGADAFLEKPLGIDLLDAQLSDFTRLWQTRLPAE